MSEIFNTILVWFLRISLSLGFLSASADRFGFWPPEMSTWGHWQSFLDYTAVLNPWFPTSFIPIIGAIVTALEIALALALLLKLKTRITAYSSGLLLLIFGISMAFTIGIKAPLDYSVFSASAAAFSLLLFENRKKK